MLEAFAEWHRALHPVWQAVVGGSGTWLLTALGASVVLLLRNPPRRMLDGTLGFAAGVMVAASCWSLLIPAIDLGGVGRAIVGLLVGAAFLFLLDQRLPHLHPEHDPSSPLPPEGPRVAWQRTILLIVAITLHNIPEGLAVGVSYGAGNWGAATALAIGIGLQNMPEGLAVSVPLRREGFTRRRALWYGQLSAIVEPIAAALGALLVLWVRPVLPYALAFAAGAMLYVVVEELIPETERAGNVDVATMGFIIGFATMMGLDAALA
ncbi:MAG TPA: ZIP family metal transporter [Gemmatimonadaceae bacterium]|nr:ZIP family metal transporter [Gemmatimonadaceae bacterium]